MENIIKSLNELEAGNVALVGVPSDENSSFLRGPAQAPTIIRAALHNGSSNLCAESGLDLGPEKRIVDVGDLRLEPGPDVMTQIEAGIDALLERDVRVLSLGGDHAVTFPIFKAHSKKHGRLNLVHLDAHPDLYDEFEGNRFSHACPFARIMEQDLAARLIQIGIRTMSPPQQAQVDRFGVEVIEASDWSRRGLELLAKLQLDGPVYLSLDLDVLDPAFGPGVSHHEPGGLSSRDVLDIIQNLQVPLIGADIVELNPPRDFSGITAMAAVKFLKEMAAVML